VGGGGAGPTGHVTGSEGGEDGGLMIHICSISVDDEL
jgi:hypothetical protein